jgi:hypothetical protein
MRPFFVLLLVGSACRFDANIPQGALIGCEQNAECPNNTRCVSFGRCALRDNFFVEDGERITPKKIGPGQTVFIRLEPINPLTDVPVVFGVTQSGRQEAVLKTNGKRFEYEWTLPQDLTGSTVLFLANVKSLNVTNVELGSVEVDREAPVLETRRTVLTPSADTVNLLGNSVQELTEVSSNMGVEVEVASNEPLAAAPELTLDGAPMALKSMNGNVFRFTGTTAALEGKPSIDVRGLARDLQGNSANQTLATLVVDTTPPMPADVDAAKKIVLVREPQGTLESGSDKPRYALRGLAGAFEPKSFVVLLSGGGVYTRIRAKDDGSIDETVIPIDNDIVSLSLRLVDSAGNASPERQVRDVEFTLKEAKTVLLEDIFSPDREGVNNGLRLENAAGADGGVGAIEVTSTPFIRAALEMVADSVGAPKSESQSLLGFNTEPCRVGFRSSAVLWLGFEILDGSLSCGNRSFSSNFLGRLISSLNTFDTVGATATDLNAGEYTALAVGAFGAGLEGLESGVNSYRPLNKDIARRFHTAALDFARSEVVIFGGQDANGTLLNDTWGYTRTGKLEKRNPAGVSPPARRSAAMAYDPVQGLMVLHGGNNGSKTLDDTWTYDGVAWVKVTERNPVARESHVMAFVRREGLVLIGGKNDTVTTPPAFQWKTGWQQPARFELNPSIPAQCLPADPTLVVPTPEGVMYLCGAATAQNFRLFEPGGRSRTVDVPKLLDVPSARYSWTKEHGIVNYLTDSKSSQPVYSLVGSAWVALPRRKGNCSVADEQLACVDGATVQFDRNAVVKLTLPPKAISSFIWNESPGAFIVNVNTEDGPAKRFRVKAGQAPVELPEPAPEVSSVFFEGVANGRRLVMLKTAEGVGRAFSEVFENGKWTRSQWKFDAGIDFLTAVPSPPGRTFTLASGDAYEGQRLSAPVARRWIELITQDVSPSIRVSLPFVAECETIDSVELQADASGSAGGVEGVQIFMWNGMDFQPTPALVISPSNTRAKTTLANPDSSFRFGFKVIAGITNGGFSLSSNAALVTTVGTTKSPFDGQLTLRSFQTRVACRAKLVK